MLGFLVYTSILDTTVVYTEIIIHHTLFDLKINVIHSLISEMQVTEHITRTTNIRWTTIGTRKLPKRLNGY